MRVLTGKPAIRQVTIPEGKTFLQIAKEVCSQAAGVICIGSCSAFGNIPAAKPNPGGYKGVGDVLIGAASLAADFNGTGKAAHIIDKLIEMIHLNETLYSCGLACSSEGHATKAGNCEIDMLLANVCKQNVTRFPYEIARLAEDIDFVAPYSVHDRC
jgi:hypothetical protein